MDAYYILLTGIDHPDGLAVLVETSDFEEHLTPDPSRRYLEDIVHMDDFALHIIYDTRIPDETRLEALDATVDVLIAEWSKP